MYEVWWLTFHAHSWEFRLFTTDIGVSPSVRVQRPDAASGTDDSLDFCGRPSDLYPHSWRSASASSSRVIAAAGPSGSVVSERVPPAHLAPPESGRALGGVGPTRYEGPAPTAALTTIRRTMVEDKSHTCSYQLEAHEECHCNLCGWII